jgi:hypothetical protein
MIEELETVVLTEDLPDEHLKAGDVGTVMFVHKDGEGYDVEFMTLEGDTIAVVTLFARSVRPVGPNEIAHARAVA